MVHHRTHALVTLCVCVSITNGLRQYLPPTKAKCTYFTGAGIYFWWQVRGGGGRDVQGAPEGGDIHAESSPVLVLFSHTHFPP